MKGTNEAAGTNYLVLVSTNLILPLTNWTVLVTNAFGLNGEFNFTNSLNPTNAQQFYRIMLL